MEGKGVRSAAVLWVVWFCSYMDEFLLRTLLQESLIKVERQWTPGVCCAALSFGAQFQCWDGALENTTATPDGDTCLSGTFHKSVSLLCSVFLLKMLSFPQHVWPENSCFLRFFQSLHFELCCGISWTYVPQLKLSVAGPCGTVQEGTDRACGRARSRWGKESVWAQLLPRNHILGGAEQLPVHSALTLLCRFTSTLSVLSSPLFCHSWHTGAFSLCYTLEWRPYSSAQQSSGVTRTDLSEPPAGPGEPLSH